MKLLGKKMGSFRILFSDEEGEGMTNTSESSSYYIFHKILSSESYSVGKVKFS